MCCALPTPPEAAARLLAPLGGEQEPDPRTQDSPEQHAGGEPAERPEPRGRLAVVLILVHALVVHAFVVHAFVGRVVGLGVVVAHAVSSACTFLGALHLQPTPVRRAVNHRDTIDF